MKDSTQTLLFIAAAVVAVFFAMYSQPSDATYRVDEQIGKSLFEPFEPGEATRMRIVRFDEQSATLREFEVAEEDGLWSLPSKGGYPADATAQMAAAATGVADLEILSIASLSAGDHADYGVVEPSSDLDAGQSGVGKRVVLQSADGETLVDIVIGSEVRGEEDQHYVRRTSQDPVYIVRIDPGDFSTSFEDWIEQDLLKLQTWDIARVRVKDYSSQLTTQLTSRGLQPVLTIDPRAEMTLAYDDSESEWRPIELREYDRDAQDYQPFELGPDQQLNEEALGEMKTAVGDLEIVDVERKPAGLSAELKAGAALFDDEAAYRSLVSRGFAPAGGDSEILSTEGEIAIALKDGVEYLLRFGNLQLESDEQQAEAPATEGEGAEPGDSAEGVNRYLFVVARFNEGLLEKPELEEVPPADAEQTDTEQADTEQADTEQTDAEQADDAPADDDGEDPSSDEPPSDDAAADQGDQSDSDEPADSAAEIEQRNQRKLDEYNDKVAAAKERVKELNERFGDWYYVISDEVYKKIALGREELIVAKQEEADGSQAADTPAGPLGGAPGAVPGLPSVPGVDFNPAAPAEPPAANGATSDSPAPAEADEPDQPGQPDEPSQPAEESPEPAQPAEAQPSQPAASDDSAERAATDEQ
ncbi:DUF4340 domain-containing protein [Botrimarina sp.]|uniref:DUF4340 domain-containing protein n=1 Tax=Botrimarina sp. TaxID=2795802 RepID=UPI0032F07E77